MADRVAPLTDPPFDRASEGIMRDDERNEHVIVSSQTDSSVVVFIGEKGKTL